MDQNNGDPQPSSPSNNRQQFPQPSNDIMASVSRFSLREKPLFVALTFLLVIMFFLLSRKQITDPAANDGAVEGNIQPPEWILKWLNSGDISSQLNLQCEKVPDNNAAKGWTLLCKKFPGGGDKNETFFLQLENSQNKSKQPSNKTGNSLCCRPCNRTETPPTETPRRPLIEWVTEKIRTCGRTVVTAICTCRRIVVTSISLCRTIIVTSISIWRRIVVESVSEITTALGIYIHRCQYHSETMSTQFEMELKKMLQKELLLQIEKAKEACKSKACLDRYPNVFQYQFKNKFNDLLKTSLHQISLELQGSIDSAAGIELITDHKQISSVEQANYAEVIEHQEQISVAQSHTEEVIKQEEIVVEESAEVIKHQEIVA